LRSAHYFLFPPPSCYFICLPSSRTTYITTFVTTSNESARRTFFLCKQRLKATLLWTLFLFLPVPRMASWCPNLHTPLQPVPFLIQYESGMPIPPSSWTTLILPPALCPSLLSLSNVLGLTACRSHILVRARPNLTPLPTNELWEHCSSFLPPPCLLILLLSLVDPPTLASFHCLAIKIWTRGPFPPQLQTKYAAFPL